MVSAGGSGSGGALCGPSGGGFLHLCSTWLGCRLLPHLISVLGQVAGSGSDNGVVCFTGVLARFPPLYYRTFAGYS